MADNGTAPVDDADVLVIGGGFAGILVSHQLKNLDGKRVVTFERAEEPGGTWYWNRYPGARVDHPSRDYSYKFDRDLYQDFDWNEVYSTQPELLRYIRYVVDRWGLKDTISTHSTVVEAAWDDEGKVWTLRVEHAPPDGMTETREYSAKYLIAATGCLSNPQPPPFEGLDTFKAQYFHTAAWPKEGVDFTGKRVAVVGTGSSGVQSIPIIAEQADKLTVFMRTPMYTTPAYNRKLTKEEDDRNKAEYEGIRARARASAGGAETMPTPDEAFADFTPEELEAHLEKLWQKGGFVLYTCFKDFITNPEASAYLQAWFHRKIDSIVKDKAVADLLKPDYPFGCKRACVDTGYYATYNRPNVELVSIAGTKIAKVGGEDGKIVLQDGREFGPFDAVVLAIGFDAMTGSILKINIRGRDGVTIQEAWKAGPATYLGLLVSKFPNMFIMAGPGSPSVLTNMLTSIEQHVDWISTTIKDLDAKGVKSIEATEAAQQDWVALGNSIPDQTFYPKCASWYLGANIPGKPQIFMLFAGGLPMYEETCNRMGEDGYSGCILVK